MKLVEYIPGRAARIYFMDCDSKHDVQAFLDEIKTTRPGDYYQFIAQLERVANHGVVQNPHKVKPLRGESAKPLWEFCAQSCSRIFWFYDRDNRSVIICTHGFIAKKNHDHRIDIKRAQQRLATYYQLGGISGLANTNHPKRVP